VFERGIDTIEQYHLFEGLLEIWESGSNEISKTIAIAH
jgi:hypothetical protein